MKKLNKVAMLFASAALVTAAGAQTVDNWKNGTNELSWKNGAGDLCWRDSNWTPATAAVGCDGAIVAAPKVEPVVERKVDPVIVPKVEPVKPVVKDLEVKKVTYASDAFYDTGKAVLKPAGKEKLDDLIGKIKGMNLEVVVATGHTDAVGSDASNQKLSIRRAESVKAYLVSKGIEKNRIYTEGKGEKQPVADNKTAEGRAKNRRVEIEVVGTGK
ncbi:MAG: OmpA family protein [Polaromonas sp.]|nr:OmpA family protein [Polaromonas sp.]